MMFLKRKCSKNIARIYECPENGDIFGLIAINGDMRDKLLERFQATFKVQGDHINTGGKISDLCIPTV
jgi:hypothetical protein